MASSRLFRPLQVGKVHLHHRMAMAPLTRFRATDSHVPSEIMVDYYRQRASVPGTFLITEGTFLSSRAGGCRNVPGIYTSEQIEAWSRVTKAVHDKNSYIFCQLWSLGRTAEHDVAQEEDIDIQSSSPSPLDSTHPPPREMSVSDIQTAIKDYAQAARNAVEAGFDGVELHGANGYLIDQFLQDKCNQRTDHYGGSVENRSRFGLEAVEAVVNAVGAERTAIRISPWSPFNGMRMVNPIPQFTHFVEQLNQFGLAYIHLVESRISGNADIDQTNKLDFALQKWSGPAMIAGGYKAGSAKLLVDEEHADKDIVVVFGRYFISTPDLPYRLKKGLELNHYNRDTFYVPKSSKGYTDYSFSTEFLDETATSTV